MDQHLRQMIAQDHRRGSDADGAGGIAPNPVRNTSEVVKKWANEPEEFLARRREREGAAMKQRPAERILQLQNLPAHSWLLDAVRNVAHRFADASVFCHVVKEFQMMDVHFARSLR